jgi:2-keto-4-pentenoate hydratase/2-oxohepta-3-ene-1,7-dioic acid hydratase in catechol pathway
LGVDRSPAAIQWLVGPYLVTQDEAGDAHDLDMWLGVGLGMRPPRFLKPNDVMTLGIEKPVT